MTAQLVAPSDVGRVSTRSAAFEGARDMTPMVLAVVPLALAIGATIGSSSVPRVAGWAGALIVFAGAAQLTIVQMLDAGAAPLVIVATALALNARVMMYSAASARWFPSASGVRRLLLALPIIDPLYVTCAARFERGELGEREREAYYVGAATFLAVVWIAAQGVAIVVGASLPDDLGLRVAAPLAFAGMLAKSASGRPALTAAIAAATVVVLGAGLPLQSAVPVAVLAGITVGRVVERRDEKGSRA